MLKHKVSVVSPPIYREHERASVLGGPNSWITLVVVALLVPAAADADSSEKPADDRAHSAQPTLQPHRPSYLLRDRTGTEQAPIIPVDFPFARRPELRFTQTGGDKPVGSPPAAQNAAFPQQVFLPAKTVVLLRLKSGKVTSRHKPGHRVLFEVEADVRSGSSTCIARGTPVYGVVGAWTDAASGVLGTGRLEVKFEGVPMGAGRQAPLHPVRVAGRTFKEALSWVSWVSRVPPTDPGSAFGVGVAAFAHATGELFARAVFRTDDVKFRKGDVIQVRLRSPSPIPCDVVTSTDSHQPNVGDAAPSAALGQGRQANDDARLQPE